MTLLEMKARGACEPGLVFAQRYGTLEEAWNACTRPDWLLWYMRECASISKGQVNLLVSDLVKRALPVYEKVFTEDNRLRRAMECLRAGDLEGLDDASVLEAVGPARREAKKKEYARGPLEGARMAANAVLLAVRAALTDSAYDAAGYADLAAEHTREALANDRNHEYHEILKEEREFQCNRIREVVGNPFRK